MHIPFNLLEMPSFSLGLSQEDGPSEASKEQEEEVPEQRKSKRQRLIPAVLQDYECDPKVTAAFHIIPDLDQRFKLMEQLVAKQP